MAVANNKTYNLITKNLITKDLITEKMNQQTNNLFDELQQLIATENAETVIDQLITTLAAQKEYHHLFEALLMKIRLQMGLSLLQPASFDDVPEEQLDEFEEYYLEIARQVGQQFLDAGNIPEAWVYFHTIREPTAVRQALDELDVQQFLEQHDEEEKHDEENETEQHDHSDCNDSNCDHDHSDHDHSDEQEQDPVNALINVALYEGANPAKGVELMLHANGICNTITTLDQLIPQMNPESRRKAVALLVQAVYQELCETIFAQIQQQHEQKNSADELPPPNSRLSELLRERDWLFADDNHHLDVSHLHSVIRFARFLEPSDPELIAAMELAEYGTKLAPQFQYPGDAPFIDFYPAHIQFFQLLADKNRDEAIAYFQAQIEQETDITEQSAIAHVLVDLLTRVEKMDAAIEFADRHLRDPKMANHFSFSQLCLAANRFDLLQKYAKENGDIVTYAATLLQKNN